MSKRKTFISTYILAPTDYTDDYDQILVTHTSVEKFLITFYHKNIKSKGQLLILMLDLNIYETIGFRDPL